MSQIFKDKTKVHCTKSGSQYIEVKDLVRSNEFKRDKELIKIVFARLSNNSEPPPIAD